MFGQNLNNLFYIAHENAFDIITVELDKEFLCSQRKIDRLGCLLGVVMKLMEKEKRKNIRTKKRGYKTAKI